MRRVPKWVFLALAFSLHAAALMTGIFWNAQTKDRSPTPPLSVSVILPSAPAPAPAVTEKPPERKTVQPKPAPMPKPRPAAKPVLPIPKAAETQAPRRASLPEPEAPSPSAAPAVSAAPPVPAVPAPVRTGVSVNASYVAGETEKWYPGISKRYGEQGTVLVRVQVSADGRAERVELKKRSDYPLLDEAAIGLAKSLKYNPAKVDGSPVADWVDIPITFRLRNP